MSGKNYLNGSAFHGIPAAILIYHTEDFSRMTVDGTEIPGLKRVMRLEVYHDSGGHYVLSPIDAAGVAGLPALLR